MAYTNAQLVRREAGDPGLFVREELSGDAVTTRFFLSSYPVMAGSQLIAVGGTLRTEVAAAPAATEYTFDDATGAIVFGAAPATGVDNITISATVVHIDDVGIEEACRQLGLVPGDTAATGATAILEAAARVCDWLAASVAGDYDFSTDGQDYKRSQAWKNWSERADSLRIRLNQQGGLVSIPVTRLDGYSRKGEYSTRDYGTTSQNPRRTYYGTPDRLP